MDTQAALATAPRESPAIQCAKDALEKVAELLAERQKLIRITDHSELGWSVVDEYIADELVDGSDDKMQMEKAVERKAAKHRLKKRAELWSRLGKGRLGLPSATPAPVGGGPARR